MILCKHGRYQSGIMMVKVSCWIPDALISYLLALANRYAATNLMEHVNEIYGLCKDQHGCRYLQKKLEEKNPQHVQMIFQETHMHVVELMTGWASLTAVTTSQLLIDSRSFRELFVPEVAGVCYWWAAYCSCQQCGATVSQDCVEPTWNSGVAEDDWVSFYHCTSKFPSYL